VTRGGHSPLNDGVERNKTNEEKEQTMKRYCVVGILIVGLGAGCATQRDWQLAKEEGSISAYEKFMSLHPTSSEAADARRERDTLIEKQAWSEATHADSLVAYQTYLNKYPSWNSPGRNSVNSAQAQRRVGELQLAADWKQACDANTVDAYQTFLGRHRSSQYTEDAKARIEQRKREAQKEAFERAVAAGTDDALIEYIKTSKTEDYDKMAVDKLKTYATVPNETLLPWSSMPSVNAGSASSGGDEYPCGVKMSAFSTRVYEGANGGWLTVGPNRYFKPDTALLNFPYWTFFDGYLVKGKALVKLDGLFFLKESTVLKKKSDGK